MAIIAITEAPATVDQYNEVNAVMGVEDDPPAGLLMHAAADMGGGQIKIVDVWEARQAAEAFYQGRLAEAVAQVTGSTSPPESPPEIRELTNLVRL